MKEHPFFEGINWQGLRDGPAPEFARPQQEPDVDSVGLDWEMSSLAAALPVAYQAHEGAPMQYTSGAGTQPQVRRPLSNLQTILVTCAIHATPLQLSATASLLGWKQVLPMVLCLEQGLNVRYLA